MVLSGRRPSELMPPTPPTYIASRIRQLARSTCVQGFNWNGGGEHEGRPWSAELPTDSALLYYLFAAFLDAPGWQFPMQGAGPESSRWVSDRVRPWIACLEALCPVNLTVVYNGRHDF
eukprot:GHUV01041100.1.p1 GENE.GHUV01041100.1~~GHUV01041100.1.p1  ORF type:complete len:118 (-),score=14.43 GHUV01041100.1:115-468(-)